MSGPRFIYEMVTCCLECPYFKEDPRFKWFCDKLWAEHRELKNMPDILDIPDWCPLSDKRPLILTDCELEPRGMDIRKKGMRIIRYLYQEIGCCLQCPCAIREGENSSVLSDWICQNARGSDYRIPDLFNIPDWCPLSKEPPVIGEESKIVEDMDMSK